MINEQAVRRKRKEKINNLEGEEAEEEADSEKEGDEDDDEEVTIIFDETLYQHSPNQVAAICGGVKEEMEPVPSVPVLARPPLATKPPLPGRPPVPSSARWANCTVVSL